MKNKLLQLLGYCIIPILLGCPFLYVNPLKENYSIFFAEKSIITTLLSILLGFFFFYLFYEAGKKQYLSYWKSSCILLYFLFLLSLFLPYIENTWFTGLHVFIAYILFLMINILMYRLLIYDKDLYSIYFGILLFGFFISLYFQSVNGIAEWIYATEVSIILTYLITKKQKSI